MVVAQPNIVQASLDTVYGTNALLFHRFLHRDDITKCVGFQLHICEGKRVRFTSPHTRYTGGNHYSGRVFALQWIANRYEKDGEESAWNKIPIKHKNITKASHQKTTFLRILYLMVLSSAS